MHHNNNIITHNYQHFHSITSKTPETLTYLYSREPKWLLTTSRICYSPHHKPIILHYYRKYPY